MNECDDTKHLLKDLKLDFPEKKEHIDKFIDSLKDYCIEDNNLKVAEKFNELMDKRMREYKI